MQFTGIMRITTLTLAATLVSSVFGVTSSVTPWPDYRMKLPAWRNERWTIILPTAITCQPGILSRLGTQECDCIDGNLCPEFLKMLEYRSTNIEELRRLTCGFIGFLPMVCCNQFVPEKTNYIPTSEVYPQVHSQIPEDYDHNCDQTFRTATTIQQRINPNPTPFHTPGIYYNVASFGEDKIPLDETYMPTTSERNYYNKRFSQDSGFRHDINYVTPRTFMHDSRRMNSDPNIHSNIPMNTNMYPEFVMKTHDVPMVYGDGNSNPSAEHFGSNPNSMYPEFSQPNYKPIYSDSTPGRGQWNSNPGTHNNPHLGNHYPTYSNVKPTTEEYYPTNHNVPKLPFHPNDQNYHHINPNTYEHENHPKHPFHPNFHPYHHHDHDTGENFLPKTDFMKPDVHVNEEGYVHNHTQDNNNNNITKIDNNNNGSFTTTVADEDVHDPLVFHNPGTFWIAPNSSLENHETNVTLNETQSQYNTSNIPLLTPRPDGSEGVMVNERQAKRKLLPTIECGVPPGERIVGGKTAQLGEYPWIVRIGYTRSGSEALLYRCAGTLLNNRYVLTAAHCVTNLPGGLELATIRLGELDERTDPDCYQSECGDPVQDYVPSHVKVHEEYDKPRFRNDLALIRLDRFVNYTNYISPVCLPFGPLRNKSYTGLKADIAGWGATNLGSTSSSPVLQWVRVTVIPTGTCAREFADRTGTRLGPGQVCAGGERGRDSCEGDSGGPLMRGEQLGPDDFTRYYLLGLVSFGAKRCGSENLPGVYTDIPAYLDWILDNIEP